MTRILPENVGEKRAEDTLTGALVSVITHDMVGPLAFDANVLGMLVAKDVVSHGDMEVLRAVHASLVQINEKASALLRMARSMHASVDTAIPAELAGGQVTELTELLRVVSEFIADHNPGFSCEIKTCGEVRVEGPSAVLRTVVENVLSNAVRHGKNGAVVSIRMYVEGVFAVICVENETITGKVTSGEPGIGLDISRKVLAACFGGTLETAGQNGTFRTEVRIPAVF